MKRFLRKNYKRIISFSMAFVLFAASVNAIPVQAYANEETGAEQAVEILAQEVYALSEEEMAAAISESPAQVKAEEATEAGIETEEKTEAALPTDGIQPEAEAGDGYGSESFNQIFISDSREQNKFYAGDLKDLTGYTMYFFSGTGREPMYDGFSLDSLDGEKINSLLNTSGIQMLLVHQVLKPE